MIPRFRAFECVTNTMWQSHEIDVCFRQDELYIEVPRGKNGAVYFGESLNRIILMQSTGLFDKNGVEIFEGDIVENTTQMVYLGHRFEVSWNGGYACFQLLNGGKSSNVPLIQDFMSYEVVGNIHENPELVEVEE